MGKAVPPKLDEVPGTEMNDLDQKKKKNGQVEEKT